MEIIWSRTNDSCFDTIERPEVIKFLVDIRNTIAGLAGNDTGSYSGTYDGYRGHPERLQSNRSSQWEATVLTVIRVLEPKIRFVGSGNE